ncbi:oxygen-insensitive NADPH nitroreductase [Paenibacillus allorhizosphaerae]|uniref:FMN reductase (NADPH) n=1 Tax=Paenibacillus allorhizosphaerae TaxID=2849866 RepID=A0ABM8VJ60_9BACL|nr:oxygen-insensitive NADPH nitroreductase [Paenibacillus allorhizosphaerae]CAG7645119.1 FMN reductase (NADPH) [Paenibacillus allorhizosphaerae]
MNPVIDLLKSHRSIRKFTARALSPEQIDAIVTSAQAASTSSNVQAYSIIAVTEPDIKSEVARLAGSLAYVEQSGLFLVFCADLHRIRTATEQQGEMFHQNAESFIVATVDAALAAQNAAIAAESMGLGVCYIGSIRNEIEHVSRLLKLPELVYPVFGLTIGVPDQEPSFRPRLPKQAVVHQNAYQPDRIEAGIEAYDEVMHEYYKVRTNGKTLTNWSSGIADKYRKPVRGHMRSFLEAQGFRLD